MPTNDQTRSVAPPRQSQSAKLPSRAELQALAEKASGEPVLFVTELPREAAKLRANFALRGLSAAVDSQDMTLATNETARTFAGMGTSMCAVVMKEVTAANLSQQPPITRAMSTIDAKGAEFRRFTALHEGAHCSALDVYDAVGLPRNPTMMDSPTLRRAHALVNEGYAEAVGALFYLREEYRSGDPRRATAARDLLQELSSRRHAANNADYQLAQTLLDSALLTPERDIRAMSDASIRSTVTSEIRRQLNYAAERNPELRAILKRRD